MPFSLFSQLLGVCEYFIPLPPFMKRKAGTSVTTPAARLFSFQLTQGSQLHQLNLKGKKRERDHEKTVCFLRQEGNLRVFSTQQRIPGWPFPGALSWLCRHLIDKLNQWLH